MEPNTKKDIISNKIYQKINKQNTFYAAQRLPNTYSTRTHIIRTVKQQNTNEEDLEVKYIDPQSQVKSAKEWWNSIDNQYYKQIKQKNILLSKDLLSGQKLINFFSDQSQLENSYIKQQIIQNNVKIGQDTLIHVLFRTSKPYSFVNYIQSFTRRSGKVQKQIIQQQQQQHLVCSISCQRLPNLQNLQLVSQDIIQQAVKIGNLQLQTKVIDQNLLTKILKIQQIKHDMKFQQQIDLELRLWQYQLQRQNEKNSIYWNNIIRNYLQQQSTKEKYSDFEQQILNIKEQLMNFTILRYFQHGIKDKTNEQLNSLISSLNQTKPKKARNKQNEKDQFFQTDCKICFCSFNYDNNQVVYCDKCDTSFHLVCYGLYQLPKEQYFLCDYCKVIAKEQEEKNASIRKITCQICCKTGFPMKQVDGHFYHMACLVIFNFVTIKQGKIQFTESLNHQSIVKKVVENQMEYHSCPYCPNQFAQFGMKLKCVSPECQCSMHPICAYLNGCKFTVVKNMKEKKIEMKILCNKHDQKNQRDYIQQTYLRRYMCNLKKTSKKSKQIFQTQYLSEIKQRQQKSSLKLSDYQHLPSLIIHTKIIRKYMSQRQPKNIQKNEQTQCTETRKMLDRLLKHNN